jgi:hypothetical protein
MKARGKCEAKRSTSPLVCIQQCATSPERAEYYFGLSGLRSLWGLLTRGDALRACPWLSYPAPSALFDLTSARRIRHLKRACIYFLRLEHLRDAGTIFRFRPRIVRRSIDIGQY